MKKLFAILAVAAIMTACNNSGETAADAQKVADSIAAAKSADSTAAAVKAAMDTVKAAVDTTVKAVDSAAKMK
ncbi:hypothetical protein [Ferruginibacter sp.]